MLRGPALTAEQVEAALRAGAALAAELCDAGVDCLALGEIGIGNTTTTAALVSALTGAPAERTVGRGTGLDAAGLERKREAVEAIERHAPKATPRPDAAPTPAPPVARRTPSPSVGGLELAALAGAAAEAARRRVPVLLDGYATGAAALAATLRDPAVGEALIASHRSAEPGHALVLERARARAGPGPAPAPRRGQRRPARAAGDRGRGRAAPRHGHLRGVRCRPRARAHDQAAPARRRRAGRRVPHHRARQGARPERQPRARRRLLPARRRGGRRARPAGSGSRSSPCSAPAPPPSLALVVLVALTGALHQDGLADTADGLGARGDRDRRLAAMRDSAIGAFGVLALIGWALLLATTLARFSAPPTPCSRWSPPARCRAGPRSCTPPPRRPPAATASAPDSRPPRRPSSSQAPPHWLPPSWPAAPSPAWPPSPRPWS